MDKDSGVIPVHPETERPLNNPLTQEDVDGILELVNSIRDIYKERQMNRPPVLLEITVRQEDSLAAKLLNGKYSALTFFIGIIYLLVPVT